MSARNASPSPEVRAKISAALKGRRRPPEVCAKISAGKKGRAVSPETRAKISRALTGRPVDDKRRAILIEANRRRQFTITDRVNLSLRAMMTDKIGPLRAKLLADPALEALRRDKAAAANKARHAAARAAKALQAPPDDRPVAIPLMARMVWRSSSKRREASA